jgi:hypothetical protein
MKQAALTDAEAVIDNIQTSGLDTGTPRDKQKRTQARKFSSRGRLRRVWNDRTKRMHEFYSDAEYKLFLAGGEDESPPAAG